MFFLGFNKKTGKRKDWRTADGWMDGQTDRRIVWNSRPLHHITSRGRRTEFLCIFEMWSRLLFLLPDLCLCCFLTDWVFGRVTSALAVFILFFVGPDCCRCCSWCFWTRSDDERKLWIDVEVNVFKIHLYLHVSIQQR